jgi:anti-sigma factor RsiW
MNRPDHTYFRDLLDLEVDGGLTAGQQASLDQHLTGCPECRAERGELLALVGLLQRSRLDVQPGFQERVMAALPAAGWESRHPRTWTFPAAVCAALMGVGLSLLGAGSARLGSVYGVVSAMGGLLRAALVAGIGFTAASWRWFGMFVEQLLGSPMSLVMFGVFVLCLNLALVTLIRRRRRANVAEPIQAARPSAPIRRAGRRGHGRDERGGSR